MLKKIFLWGIFSFVLVATAFIVYRFFLIPEGSLKPIYLVPEDAIYIIETEEPVDSWEKIRSSQVWEHLQQNAYFAHLTKNANSLDSLFQNNKTLFKLLGSRALVVSAHMYKRSDYDFLFVVDLQKVSKLVELKNYLQSLLSDNFKVTRRDYHDREIIELYDRESRETLHLSFIENLLVASYTHTLVEASIDQLAEPVIGRDIHFIEVNKKVDHDNMFRIYVQYGYLDDYMLTYMNQHNEYVKSLSEYLKFSAFSFNFKKNHDLLLNGYTNINEDSASYLQVIRRSGKGGLSITKVAPQRTAFYMGMGFDSFEEFYDNFEAIIQNHPEKFKEYQDGTDRIEKFLKIDIKENFISWVDDEIAFIQMQNSGLGKENEFALVLKAKDSEDANEHLEFIIKQIKRKTPVKFKKVVYKDYPINFLSVKGFFRLIFGKLFSNLDKPYFTIIDDYVIFSNHPQTLKNIINDYHQESTLANSDDFQTHMKQFDQSSNLFLYVNTPVLHENLKGFVSKQTSYDLDRNKNFIICFPQVAFQMTSSGDLFETKLALQYLNPQIVEEKIQFSQNPEKFLLSAVGPIQDNDPTEISNAVLMDMVEEEEIIEVAEISPDDLDAKKHQEFYEDGALKLEVPLKDGLKHGTYREYYPNGSIKIKGKYRRDQQNGVWKVYDEEGNTIERKRYRAVK
ncbi:DUF3352 domain-containing protein [Fulvivirgaceae bacterium BMA10]|uniref:DUF3352 domain-containing protein n=1 Tax=Splendidivirga corallicola TaxID=3051826 RepID=A0ABT8KL33_9BACT|nr:DUF3352 domain-containing protein [Fulvivirgaceae bacterium BMA10]